jgi:hypothetical protein
MSAVDGDAPGAKYVFMATYGAEPPKMRTVQTAFEKIVVIGERIDETFDERTSETLNERINAFVKDILGLTKEKKRR